MFLHMDKLQDSVSWSYACSYATTYVRAAVEDEGLKELDHYKCLKDKLRINKMDVTNNYLPRA